MVEAPDQLFRLFARLIQLNQIRGELVWPFARDMTYCGEVLGAVFSSARL